MKLLKTKRYEIRMSNHDWKQLLRRFDLNNTRLGMGEYYINKSCICGKYPECVGCPFELAASGAIGCMDILIDVIPSAETSQYIDYSYKDLSWSEIENEQARKEIKAVHKWLLSAEDV